jgi:anti-sigma factor (TIGR02949 family)
MSRLSCQDATRRFFAYLDRALAGEVVEKLEEHLGACLDCCDRLQFSRRLDGFVRQRLGQTALPPSLADRIRRGLALAERAKE